MATGDINNLSLLELSGLSIKSTDSQSTLFNHFLPAIKNVGYITKDVFVVVYLWNGSYTNNLIITSISGNAGAEGFSWDVSIPLTILPRSSKRVVITVSSDGPLSFSENLTFYSSCSYNRSFIISGTRPLIVTEQPRPIDLTTAMEEAYLHSGIEYTVYDTLEFVSDGASGKVMIVHSDEELTTPQGDFVPCKFDCTLPETEGAVRGEMQISVGFLPKSAQIWLRQASGGREKITVKWRQYLGANLPPDAEYPIPLEVISVEQNSNGATATALFPDLVNMPFPRRRMTTKVLPGGMV